MLPFILAGMFLPTWTSKVILFLGTDRALPTSTGYVAGNWIWRFGLGFTVLWVANVAAPAITQRESIPPWAGITLGSILIALGLFLVVRHPRSDPEAEQELPSWMKAFRKLPPWATAIYGLVNCAMPGVQWVYFLGAMGVLASSRLSNADQMVLLIVTCTMLQTMLLIPIVIFAVRRQKAAATFENLELWLARNGGTTVVWILAALGGFLAIAAIYNGLT
jgi:hypothetical protein